jgi:hypothetical protein
VHRHRRLRRHTELPRLVALAGGAGGGCVERDELLHLCEQVAPPLTFERAPGKAMLTILLSRAIFEPARVLNPESFFWLRRWTKHGAEFEERA